MRILHTISGIEPQNGGPTTALVGLTRAQAALGLQVTVAATWQLPEAEKTAQRLRDNGVRVELIGPATGALSRHPDLQSRVDRLVADADVVHVHALWEEIQHQAARAAHRQGKPYIMRPCGMLDPWSLSQGKWKKKAYMALRLRRNLNQAAAIHFTAGLERDLTAPLKLKAPAIVEPNGVDLREFEHLPQPGSFRSRHPELAGRQLVLFLSRIHRKKGLDLLIPAFAQANVPGAVLVIAGPDTEGYGPEVRRMIDENRLQDRAMMIGPVYGADRVAALADADLFALPSYSENFGIAVVEALAAGRPVVISDRVNIHHEISSAEVGGVVPLDVPRLAGELKRWLADGQLREAAAARTRPFVWKTYGWDQIAARWREHYEELAPSAARRQPGPAASPAR